MRDLKQSQRAGRQKVEWWLAEAGAGERGKGELLINGYRVSASQHKKSLAMVAQQCGDTKRY